ncbi:hypothetical protein Pmani_007466 [Petrolisthes manimaculis]|uniref:Dynein regulatory complex subunit 7 MORN domain-containing protein n=1 Tax=Petrolisthes manimaculis TaxID=1843537 RepID=A0AAE1Q8N8_9EUCA|nr:hypothetical protein Pmani_007466 [Petrolisthes manimaculis]
MIYFASLPALRLRFPGGWREEEYHGVLVRRYAPFCHQDGTTLVITTRDDNGVVNEVREEFSHRQDRLVCRVTKVKQGSVTDTFSTTRTDTLREHQYWRCPSSLSVRVKADGVNNPWQAQQQQQQQQQVFHFHSRFRVDALRKSRKSLAVLETKTLTKVTKEGEKKEKEEEEKLLEEKKEKREKEEKKEEEEKVKEGKEKEEGKEK